jgi:hypothetical protein
MSQEYELDTGNAVVSWVDGVDPEDWRNQPDPDGEDNDDALDMDDPDIPAEQWLIDILGFDPDEEEYEEVVSNVFCPTGKGGGTDPTCSPGKSGGGIGKMPTTRPTSVLEFKKKGGSPEEIKKIHSLESKRFNVKKKMDKAEGTEKEAFKKQYDDITTELKGVKQTIRDRYSKGGGDQNKEEPKKKEVKAEKKKKEVVKKEETKKEEAKVGKKDHSDQFGVKAPEFTRDDIGDMSPMELLNESVGSNGPVLRHGMTKAEHMRVVRVDGVDVAWETGLESATITSMRDARTVHPRLWEQNKFIVLTHQENKNDVYWTAKFGKPMVSSASGGDGGIAVYNGRSMDRSTLAHESAHNLEYNLFSITGAHEVSYSNKNWNLKDRVIDKAAKWSGKEDRVSNAVTDYGKNSRAEDFAEFVTVYDKIRSSRPSAFARGIGGKSGVFYKGKVWSMTRLQGERPTTFKTVQFLLGDATTNAARFQWWQLIPGVTKEIHDGNQSAD